MSSPNVAVLNRFLIDYLEIRLPWWRSTANKVLEGMQKKAGQIIQTVTHGFSQIKSWFVGSEAKQEEETKDHNDEVINTGICVDLMKQFESTKTVDAWIKVISDLSELARGRKPDTLFYKTLQAMRSYIISHIKDEPAYIEEIARLKLSIQALDTEIETLQLENKDINRLNSDRDKLWLTLCDLGDKKSLLQSMRWNILPNLDKPHPNNKQGLNIHFPLYYQETFHVFYHLSEIVPYSRHEDFEGFEIRANKGRYLVEESSKIVQVLVGAMKANKMVEPSQSPSLSPSITGSPKSSSSGSSSSSSSSFSPLVLGSPGPSNGTNTAPMDLKLDNNLGHSGSTASPPPLATTSSTKTAETIDSKTGNIILFPSLNISPPTHDGPQQQEEEKEIKNEIDSDSDQGPPVTKSLESSTEKLGQDSSLKKDSADSSPSSSISGSSSLNGSSAMFSPINPANPNSAAEIAKKLQEEEEKRKEQEAKASATKTPGKKGKGKVKGK